LTNDIFAPDTGLKSGYRNIDSDYLKHPISIIEMARERCNRIIFMNSYSHHHSKIPSCWDLITINILIVHLEIGGELYARLAGSTLTPHCLLRRYSLEGKGTLFTGWKIDS